VPLFRYQTIQSPTNAGWFYISVNSIITKAQQFKSSIHILALHSCFLYCEYQSNCKSLSLTTYRV